MTVELVFKNLDRLLPPNVDREAAGSAFRAGETEGAVAALLEDAFEAGELSQTAVDLVVSADLAPPHSYLVDAIVSSWLDRVKMDGAD